MNGCIVENLPDLVYQSKQLRFLEVTMVKAKSLPKSFCNLRNLETLDLSKSSLEKLPNSINKLVKLKNLCLRGCSLLRRLPESFSKLEFLSHLDLSDCCSLQLLPKSFGNLSRLWFLQLSGCSELQKLPDSITDLTFLTHLDISGCSSLKVLPELFGNISNLQLLYLSGCSELKKLPESLGNIVGLQHLNLSDCRSLQELPNSFGNLCNLKKLDLSGSELPNLPESISYIVNLEHLNLSHCYKLDGLPDCFGNLQNLKSLNLSSCRKLRNLPESLVNSDKLVLDLEGCSTFASTEIFVNSEERYNFQQVSEIFVCREIEQAGRKCSNIVRLKHLNHIQGNLHITCIENVHSSEEAERAKLCNKSKLHSLALQWNTFKSLADGKIDELVVEKLQPDRKLQLLNIDGYRGAGFPSWILKLESSLPCLTQLTLCNLPNCEQLPLLEHLTYLEILEISNAPKIKRIQTDMQPSEGSFRMLKTLSIREMPDLEDWSITGSTNDIKLEKLVIYRCPRVICRPCLPSTETLIVTESSMSLSLGSVPFQSSKSRVSKMCIDNCSITSDDWEGLRCYIIRDLEIRSCKELYVLPKSILCLTSIWSLTIKDCNGLFFLPDWLGDLTSLRSLSICQCQNLKSFPLSIQCLTALKDLHMQNCSPELVEGCLGMDKNIISHVRNVTHGMFFFERFEEIFDFEDILKTAEMLGRGAFGITYKVTLEKRQDIVVKRIKGVNITGREFRDKMRALCAMNHPNVMPIRAYHYSTDEQLLVYDFMSMRSVSFWLHEMTDAGPPFLNWFSRSGIILAVAQGLKYIHAISPQCAHGNIKASNILLFGNDGLLEGAKIDSHGLANLIGGSAPADDAYKAPELTDFHEATHKSDVYSFGMLLLELLSGMSPEQAGLVSRSLQNWTEEHFQDLFLDIELRTENQRAQQDMMQMMKLALECTSSEPRRRPTMECVLHRIDDIFKPIGSWVIF